MEQKETFDIEKLLTLSKEEREVAMAEYTKSIEKSVREAAAAEHLAELSSTKYECAKYKMSLDKTLPGFGERLEAIEEILASNGALSSMSDEDRLRTAYYIDRGRRKEEPKDVKEIFKSVKENPELMHLLELEVIERLKAKKAPPITLGQGNASLPLTPKEKPKNISEASKMAREAFGL